MNLKGIAIWAVRGRGKSCGQHRDLCAIRALEAGIDYNPGRGDSKRQGHTARVAHYRRSCHRVRRGDEFHDEIGCLWLFQAFVSGKRVWPSEEVNLSFRDSDYHPLDLRFLVGLRSSLKKLTVAELEPVAQPSGAVGKPSVVSNIRIRYSVNYRAKQIFAPVWRPFKLSIRETCRASNNIRALRTGSGRHPRVRLRWTLAPITNSATCAHRAFPGRAHLLGSTPADIRAEAASLRPRRSIGPIPQRSSWKPKFSHYTTDSNVRESYPVIYGRVMHFTLPSNQEGVSIEAEIDGSPMVFPPGPDLYTSWATCSCRRRRGKLYRLPARVKKTRLPLHLKPIYCF